MTHSSPSEDRFASAVRLLDGLIERQQAGDAVTFDDLVAEHPELERELRELHGGIGEVDRGLDEARRAVLAEQAQVEQLLAGLGGADRARYRIETQVGKGGMGAVYRVHDTRLDRPLAMKVILGQAAPTRSGQTPPVEPSQLARFLNEAKITSHLDHPGIVPVHELGVDESGRAFFTMKLVSGQTLGEVFARLAAGDPRWTRTRVLDVLLRVCEAMAFAHERQVVHRDLKPANVMVGDFGEVYVMDWGLARRLDTRGARDGAEVVDDVAADPVDEQLAAQLTLTRDGHVLGTPAYMSPEQAQGRLAEIGPASDVYALGAMLYQLIARHPPYCRPGESTTADAVLRRLVAEPPEPLTQRDTPPELIAICEKAMSRRQDARYRDTRELATDLRAFIDGRAVQAYRTGAWVETIKWMQRNRGLSASLGAALLAILAGGAGFAVQAERATQASELAARRADEAQAATAQAEASAHIAQTNETIAKEREAEARTNARRATRVVEFVRAALMASDPNRSGAQGLLVTEAMDKAIEQLDRGELDDDPEVETTLQVTIARILAGNARADEALRLAQEALETRRAMATGDDAGVAECINLMAHCLQALQRGEEALPLWRSALEMRRRLHAGDHDEIATTLSGLGECLLSLSRFDEALAVAEEARAMRSRLPTDELETARCTDLCAKCLLQLGRLDEALPLFEDALERSRRLSPSGHPDVARALNNAAICLRDMGRADEALPLQQEAVALYRRFFAGDYDQTASCLTNEAMCLQDLGRFDEALKAHLESLEMRRSLTGDNDHPDVAVGINNVGYCLSAQGRDAEALPLYQASLGMDRRLFGDDRLATAVALQNVGACLLVLGRQAEALPDLDASISAFKSIYPAGHLNTVRAIEYRAECLQALGRLAEARASYREALDLLQALDPTPTRDTIDLHKGVAATHEAAGQFDDALPWRQQALELAQTLFDEDDPAVAEALNNVAGCLQQVGRRPEAITLFEQALGIDLRRFPDGNGDVARQMNNLAMALRDDGRDEEALPLLISAAEMNARVLGEESPYTAITLNNVALCLQKLGRPREALPYAEHAVAIAETALPEGHLRRVAFESLFQTLREASMSETQKPTGPR